MDCFSVLMGDGFGELTIEHQGMAARAMLGVVGRTIRHPMAIRAHQLCWAVGPLQIALQVHLVTKLDGPGIGRVPWPHCGEVRMSAVEGCDVRRQVSVALRTRLLTCRG